MDAYVEKIFVTSQGSRPMQLTDSVETIAGCGIEGDRYCLRKGYWTGVDECQVTLIEAEDMEEIERSLGIKVEAGQHRRNIVTRNIRLDSLRGKRFQVGQAVLEYDRPRPPCAYIESITQPGMMRALVRRGGICARVIQAGTIKTGDQITVL